MIELPRKVSRTSFSVKFNVLQVQPLAGANQVFLVFVKDNVHSPDARPAALHAGKYVNFGKGEIFDQFLSHQGLKSNPHDFFFCANEVDFIEDRTIPFVNAKRTAPVATAKKAPQQSEPEEILSSESDDKQRSLTLISSTIFWMFVQPGGFLGLLLTENLLNLI